MTSSSCRSLSIRCTCMIHMLKVVLVQKRINRTRQPTGPSSQRIIRRATIRGQVLRTLPASTCSCGPATKEAATPQQFLPKRCTYLRTSSSCRSSGAKELERWRRKMFGFWMLWHLAFYVAPCGARTSPPSKALLKVQSRCPGIVNLAGKNCEVFLRQSGFGSPSERFLAPRWQSMLLKFFHATKGGLNTRMPSWSNHCISGQGFQWLHGLVLVQPITQPNKQSLMKLHRNNRRTVKKQTAGPIGYLFWKLSPPPCAVHMLGDIANIMSLILSIATFNWCITDLLNGHQTFPCLQVFVSNTVHCCLLYVKMCIYFKSVTTKSMYISLHSFTKTWTWI